MFWGAIGWLSTRVRSLLTMPFLPLVDIARRRAREAALPEFAEAALATTGFLIGAEGFIGADTVAAAAFAPRAALPDPDNALRLARATARPEFA